jgi:hypothetical protein
MNKLLSLQRRSSLKVLNEAHPARAVDIIAGIAIVTAMAIDAAALSPSALVLESLEWQLLHVKTTQMTENRSSQVRQPGLLRC